LVIKALKPTGYDNFIISTRTHLAKSSPMDFLSPEVGSLTGEPYELKPQLQLGIKSMNTPN